MRKEIDQDEGREESIRGLERKRERKIGMRSGR